MATPTIRSTYALDVATVQALDQIARRWNLSKSAALRRAIRAAAEAEPSRSGEALRALDQLQRSLKLTPARARSWASRARTERKAASARSESRAR